MDVFPMEMDVHVMAFMLQHGENTHGNKRIIYTYK